MYNEYKGDTREMDWTARLNKVMDYVEENIHGEIARGRNQQDYGLSVYYVPKLFFPDRWDSLFRICEKKASDHGSL